MNEIVKINWMVLASFFLWVTGFALLLAALVVMKKRKLKKAIFISVVLIVAGGVLYFFKMPSDKLLVSRVSVVDIDKCIPVDGGLSFAVRDLGLDALNRGHKRNTTGLRDNTAALFYGGYIKTPFITFPGGDYAVVFHARGTRAKEEYAILKVEFEHLDDANYLITEESRYIPLNKSMRRWVTPFRVNRPGIGRVKISFVNDDLEPGSKRDRNAWIKDIKILKHKNG